MRRGGGRSEERRREECYLPTLLEGACGEGNYEKWGGRRKWKREDNVVRGGRWVGQKRYVGQYLFHPHSLTWSGLAVPRQGQPRGAQYSIGEEH